MPGAGLFNYDVDLPSRAWDFAKSDASALRCLIADLREPFKKLHGARMQSALITGGSGYFGSLLLRKLRDGGEQCRVFDLNDADDRPSEVEFVRGDIRDYDAIVKACAGIDVVYHNVAQVPLAKDRQLFESVNVLGTEIFLKAARDAGVKKVIYTSTCSAYGIPPQNPITEDMEPSTEEAYGKSKYEGELLCHRYAEQGLDVSILRPCPIIGHGRLGILHILFEWLLEGVNLPVFGKGDNCYQFVHADDFADACILAAGRSGSATYNCGTDRFGTMRELLQHLCDYAGTGSRVRSVPMAPAEWAMKVTTALGISPLGSYHALMYGRSMYFDISKARKELGWNPEYSNNEMYIQSFEWYRRNRASIQTVASEGLSHHRFGVKQGILRLARWVL